MIQLALDIPIVPTARRSDPETSHAAAARAAGFAGKHEATIFRAIDDAGIRGATAKEIACLTGLTDVQVNRRLGAMGRPPGVIQRNGEKRGGCMVWVRV